MTLEEKVWAYGVEHAPHTSEEIIDALVAFAREHAAAVAARARDEALEEAAKSVCQYCRRGVAIQVGRDDHLVGPRSIAIGSPCAAVAIRALKSQGTTPKGGDRG